MIGRNQSITRRDRRFGSYGISDDARPSTYATKERDHRDGKNVDWQNSSGRGMAVFALLRLQDCHGRLYASTAALNMD